VVLINIELEKTEELEKILLFNAASEYIDSSWQSMGKGVRIFLQYYNAYTLAESQRMLTVMKAFRKKCTSDMCVQSDMSNMLIEDFLYELHVGLESVTTSEIFHDRRMLDNGWYRQFVGYTCNQINNYWVESENPRRLTNTGVMHLLNISQSKHSEWQAKKTAGPTLPIYISRSALNLGGISLSDLTLMLP
jgi:hypothetical protein